jgi:hypothetical protein
MRKMREGYSRRATNNLSRSKEMREMRRENLEYKKRKAGPMFIGLAFLISLEKALINIHRHVDQTHHGGINSVLAFFCQ